MKRDDRPDNLADSLAREIENRIHHPSLVLTGLKPVLGMVATLVRAQDQRISELEKRAGLRQ